MRLSSEWIEYGSDGESVSAYITRPAGAREELPGVVVIQEVWGVDAHIRDVADRIAASGYVALAPDLYSRGGRPAELGPERIDRAKAFLETLPPAGWMDPERRADALGELPPAEAEEIGASLRALLSPERPIDRYVVDLRAGLAVLAGDPGCDGRVGSIGFCLGGALSARLACADPALGAAIVFYGAAPAPELVEGIMCPVLGFYGAEDHRVNAGLPGFIAAMGAAGKEFDPIVYAGAPHAFFNDTRGSYRPAAARDAWARTLGFLAGLAPASTAAPPGPPGA
ncbi:MAG: dienelactone hydrolase family protein [Actinobacteria bacterium]|nr:dienelactone hydrolase family protein [Actinomycetota bacterium]